MHYTRWKRHGDPLHTDNERHGNCGSPEYIAWNNLKNRCNNPNNSRYAHYGGRGIKVCDSWKTSFINFYNDMGERPTPYHSIDRIDNDGNYEPSNCRWATNSQQNLNRKISPLNRSGHRGVRYYKKYDRWVAYITINYKQKFLGYYDTYEEAVEKRIASEKIYIT